MMDIWRGKKWASEKVVWKSESAISCDYLTALSEFWYLACSYLKNCFNLDHRLTAINQLSALNTLIIALSFNFQNDFAFATCYTFQFFYISAFNTR
jgi:hypothetical protein